MERLTTRHSGVAVIKDKSKHKEAMEKLARMEEIEEEGADMDKIVEEMLEHICDHICIAPRVIGDEEQMHEFCRQCKMEKFACDICNKYNQINDFVNSQAGKLLMMYRNFVFCHECVYCQNEEDCRWCKKKDGLDGHLEDRTGCTRGKRWSD